MRESASEDDVFSAVGGLEMGRHDAGAYVNQAAGGSYTGLPPTSQAEALLNSAVEAQQLGTGSVGGSRYGLGPMIGDLPFSDTPSRTLIVRNVSATSSDKDFHQLFEVRPSTQHKKLHLSALIIIR